MALTFLIVLPIIALLMLIIGIVDKYPVIIIEVLAIIGASIDAFFCHRNFKIILSSILSRAYNNLHEVINRTGKL